MPEVPANAKSNLELEFSRQDWLGGAPSYNEVPANAKFDLELEFVRGPVVH